MEMSGTTKEPLEDSGAGLSSATLLSREVGEIMGAATRRALTGFEELEID